MYADQDMDTFAPDEATPFANEEALTGLEPQPEEVLAMGRYLGIGIDRGEQYLLSVAREAVAAPVLAPWQVCDAEVGSCLALEAHTCTTHTHLFWFVDGFKFIKVLSGRDVDEYGHKDSKLEYSGGYLVLAGAQKDKAFPCCHSETKNNRIIGTAMTNTTGAGALGAVLSIQMYIRRSVPTGYNLKLGG